VKPGARAKAAGTATDGDAARSPLAFRLYIAGSSPNTTRAIANLRQACEAAGFRTYELTIIDVVREPRRALDDGILVAPTLVKTAPGPARRIVGDLRDHAAVISLLDLVEHAA
jgi:circadian clock protein KaiB